MKALLPDNFIVPDPYGLPNHTQGNKNNCTSLTFGSLMEEQLSHYFKERTLVDVDSLWENQKKYGTATEQGDYIHGPVLIAEKLGVKFQTDSGKKGKLYWTKNGWKVRMNNSPMHFFNFLKKKPKLQPVDHGPSPLQREYNNAYHAAFVAGLRTIRTAPKVTIEFSDSALADFIEKEFADLSPLEVQLWDHGVQQNELRHVSEKYAGAFREKRLGGIGTTVPEAFINLAQYSLGLLFTWGLAHIINDLDTKVWEMLKRKIVNLYQRLGNKPEKKIAIVTSSTIFDRKRPTILFQMPSGLSVEEFVACINFMADQTISIISIYSESQESNFYKFTYNAIAHAWSVSKKHTSD